MDADHRHELEKNDLAESTVAVLDRIRPHLGTILLAALAAVAAVAAWEVVGTQRAAASAQSWDACMAALGGGNADQLADVIRRYPGTPAAQWSQLLMADAAIADGSQLLFADRAKARERLESAVGFYSAVLAERPLPLIAERATFGLAKARECLGQLDEARRGYEALVKEYPSSAVRGLAAGRIAALSRGSARQWYDWFDGWKPAPADTQPATGGNAQPAGSVPAGAGPGAGAGG